MALPLMAVLDLGAKILDKFIPDPKAKAEAQQKLLEMHQKGELEELNAAMNVIVAEAKSEHVLAATWRPITMLVFVAIIANNYILAPYLTAMFGVGLTLEIPTDMWDLLKIGLGGYVVGRSMEKGIKTWKGSE